MKTTQIKGKKKVKMNTKETTDKYYSKRNTAVSLARSNEWKKKLVNGKLDSQLNPSKLKISRVKMNVPQEVISKKVGLSISYYGMIERGTRMASKDMALKISKLMSGAMKDYFVAKGKKFEVIK
jgi:DNA-binding XRE family transcriptional regulator